MDHPREDPYWGVGPTVRRLLLGSGPLKRGTDRAQLLLRVLTLGALLLLAPAGMAVGSTVHSHMHVRPTATWPSTPRCRPGCSPDRSPRPAS